MIEKQIKSILVDSGVVLDFIDDSRRHHHEAVNILLNLDRQQTKLLITTQTVNNIFKEQIIKLKNTDIRLPKKTIYLYVADYLNDLLELFTIVGTDHFDVKHAIKLIKTHVSFEQNLLIAAAERSKTAYILTISKQMLIDFPKQTIDYKNLEKLLNF